MTDLLDTALATGRSAIADDPAVVASLSALADARSVAAQRKRRIAVPSIVIGALLAVGTGGAVAANQWGPWGIAEPDLVIARDWTDVNGTYLGSCESRVGVAELSPTLADAVRDYFASIDVVAIAPDPEWVAAELTAVGRTEDMSRLIAGSDVSDFDVHHDGELWSAEWFSDARILQDATLQAVFYPMATQYPDLNELDFFANIETQCTTDPS